MYICELGSWHRSKALSTLSQKTARQRRQSPNSAVAFFCDSRLFRRQIVSLRARTDAEQHEQLRPSGGRDMTSNFGWLGAIVLSPKLDYRDFNTEGSGIVRKYWFIMAAPPYYVLY